MNVPTFRIEKRAIPRKTITLADLPNVSCVCWRPGFHLLVLIYDGEHIRRLNVNREPSNLLDVKMNATSWQVIQRLDGQPLPQLALPKTLADEGVEEGRLYVCWGRSGYRCVANERVWEVREDWICAAYNDPKDYYISAITDSVLIVGSASVQALDATQSAPEGMTPRESCSLAAESTAAVSRKEI